MKYIVKIRTIGKLKEILDSIRDTPTIKFTGYQAHYVDNVEFETEYTHYKYDVSSSDDRYADDDILSVTKALDELDINYPQLHRFYSKAKLNKNLSEINVGD